MMMGSGAEKFCLRWSDFESTMGSALRDIRDNAEFFDVTIVCDEGQQVKAHKLILSACSPFFRSLLKRNPHEHPLLYLRGIKYVDLSAILDFMYHGEVNVSQANLNSFLCVAEDLCVKGLTQSQSDSSTSVGGATATSPPPPPLTKLLPTTASCGVDAAAARDPSAAATPAAKRFRQARPSAASAAKRTAGDDDDKAEAALTLAAAADGGAAAVDQACAYGDQMSVPSAIDDDDGKLGADAAAAADDDSFDFGDGGLTEMMAASAGGDGDKDDEAYEIHGLIETDERTKTINRERVAAFRQKNSGQRWICPVAGCVSKLGSSGATRKDVLTDHVIRQHTAGDRTLAKEIMNTVEAK